MAEFTHLDEKGKALMVDISEKNITKRTALATGTIMIGRDALEALKNQAVPKGDVLAAARIAGIFACKKTPEIVPLCHNISITKASVDFEILEESFAVKALCSVSTTGKTGAEMEALTGVNAALLTIYDMCKAINKSMVMTDIHLVSKTGGKSGDFEFGV